MGDGMNKVIILTDSTSDIDKDLMKLYDIHSIPIIIRIGDEFLRDGIDVTPEDLEIKTFENQAYPKTQAVTTADFMYFFDRYMRQGHDVVYIGIGSHMSSSVGAAELAKLEFPEGRIFIVDSQSISSGVAILAIKAKELRDQGLSADEIAEEVTELVPNVRHMFMTPQFKTLYINKRITKSERNLGRWLRLKLIIGVTNGSFVVLRRRSGTVRKALIWMIEHMLLDRQKIDLNYVMVTHSLAHQQAKFMMRIINAAIKPKQIIESHAGCVITIHAGVGTIGLTYIVKE